MKVLGKIWLAVVLTWVTFGVACGGPSRTTIDIFVASSLAEAFETLERQYESENPQVDIRLNIAGSSTLVRQINAGADADIFVPADVEILTRVEQQVTGESQIIATNRLTLLVPKMRDEVTTVDDLSQQDIVVSRCASGVPCGDATDTYLDQTGTKLHAPSEHTNVGGVVGQVVAGDVAAGFAYETDARRVRSTTRSIPLENAPTLTPVIVELKTTAQTSAFVEHVLSTSGRAVMDELGFGGAPTDQEP